MCLTRCWIRRACGSKGNKVQKVLKLATELPPKDVWDLLQEFGKKQVPKKENEREMSDSEPLADGFVEVDEEAVTQKKKNGRPGVPRAGAKAGQRRPRWTRRWRRSSQQNS